MHAWYSCMVKLPAFVCPLFQQFSKHYYTSTYRNLLWIETFWSSFFEWVEGLEPKNHPRGTSFGVWRKQRRQNIGHPWCSRFLSMSADYLQSDMEKCSSKGLPKNCISTQLSRGTATQCTNNLPKKSESNHVVLSMLTLFLMQTFQGRMAQVGG